MKAVAQVISAARFQFGEFEFDSDTGVLTRKGGLVRLQAQPAMLLKALLERHNQVVTREELKETIWGEGTHVDFEKGLNFCVGQVRTALRDDASRPLYISTIPKQGYQFIAPVRIIEQGGADRALAEAPPAQRRPWIPLAVVASGLVALAIFAGMSLSRTRDRSVPNLAVVRFDTETDTPAMKAMADSITDDIVVRLTAASDGRYRVIGNASILRQPREQRDLRAIAASLHSDYAVLGQVRSEGNNKVLILAHLIRLSDLTHIWVVRFECNPGGGLSFVSDAASQIAAQFSNRMMHQPDRAASF